MALSSKDTQPKFSIVIPVHNGEDFLAFTLESILNQTYQNFDIVILENASQDRTVEIIKSFKDPRITTLHSDRFLTIEENWARILDLPLNEYLCIFCHDDPPYIDFLHEIVNLIAANPDASLYHTHAHIIGDGGNIIAFSPPIPYKESADEFILNFNLGQRNVTGSGFVMRSKDYKAVGGIPALYRLHFSDVIFYYKVTMLAYKACSPKYLCAYRSFSQSTGQKASIYEAVLGSKTYLEKFRELECSNSKQHMDAANSYVFQYVNAKNSSILFNAVYTKGKTQLSTYRQELQLISQFPDFDRSQPYIYPLWTQTSRYLLYVTKLPFQRLRMLGVSLLKMWRIIKRIRQRYVMILAGLL